MTHPSIIKARELLAHLDEKEVEYEAWREANRDALDDIFLTELKARDELVTKKHPQGGLVFKTNYQALQSKPQLQPQRAVNVDDLRRPASRESLRHLAEKCGAGVGKVMRHVDTEVAALREQIAELRGAQQASQEIVVELQKLRAEMRAMHERDRQEVIDVIDVTPGRKRNVMQ